MDHFPLHIISMRQNIDCVLMTDVKMQKLYCTFYLGFLDVTSFSKLVNPEIIIMFVFTK